MASMPASRVNGSCFAANAPVAAGCRGPARLTACPGMLQQPCSRACTRATALSSETSATTRVMQHASSAGFANAPAGGNVAAYGSGAMHQATTEVILDSPGPSGSSLLGTLRLDVMGLAADEDTAGGPLIHAEAPTHSSDLRQESMSHYVPADEDSANAAQHQHVVLSRHDGATSAARQAELRVQAGNLLAPRIRSAPANRGGAAEDSLQHLDPAHNGRSSAAAAEQQHDDAEDVPPALSARERRAGVASSSGGPVAPASVRGRALRPQAARQQQSEAWRRAPAAAGAGDGAAPATHDQQLVAQHDRRVGRQSRPAQAVDHAQRSTTAQQPAAAHPRAAYPIQRVPPAFYQQQQQPIAPADWDYPYLRRPAASPCDPADTACLKLEALFQNVLRYPRALPRLCRFLRHQPGGIAPRLPTITGTVQKLNDLVGREVALYLLRRVPWLVLVPASELTPRIENVRSMLGVRGPELLMTIRKNPQLLRLDRFLVRQRYDTLHDTAGFTQEQVGTGGCVVGGGGRSGGGRGAYDRENRRQHRCFVSAMTDAKWK